VDDDPDPVITKEIRRALLLHAPDALPTPPPDVSNRFADDTAAALFGRRLFFDGLFSGRLLDGDNDGSQTRWATAATPAKWLVPAATLPIRVSPTHGRSERRRRWAPVGGYVGRRRYSMWGKAPC